MGQAVAIHRITFMNHAQFTSDDKHETRPRPKKLRHSKISTPSSESNLPGETSRSHQIDLLLDSNPVSEKLQEIHAWNDNDRSPGISIKNDDPMTVRRLPVQQTTDAVRGRVGYTRGIHAWTVRWEKNQRGTHAAIGVATADMPLRVSGYRCLVGCDRNSWGWDVSTNRLWHDRKSCVGLVPCGLNGYFFQGKVDFVTGLQLLPEEITVVLDMEAGTLGYAIDGKYLGVAFDGLKGKTLYPTVSAVWGQCEVTMKYIGGLEPGPSSLGDLCRFTIRQQVGKERSDQMDQLPLPSALVNYLRQPVTSHDR